MPFLNELDNLLRQQFDLNSPFLNFDDKILCNTFSFSSDMEFAVSSFSGSNLEDEEATDLVSQNPENKTFRYAVFYPANRTNTNRAIILLHGLNERSWDKYLVWAYKLADLSGRAVVLFPLANHINRSPRWWSTPRKMASVVDKRNNCYGKIPNSSFVNAALSYRIDHYPDVFISSGLQSISDIVKLTKSIQAGEHPLFSKGTGVDFFAYSIGALATEVLLMANPMRLFSHSRAFFFCGGSTFDQMDGRSRNILDNRAYWSLKEFVNKSDFFKVTSLLPTGLIPYGNTIIKSFSSLISFNNWEKDYESVLGLLSGRIRAVGLKLDKVIPGDAICKTLCVGGFSQNVSVANFDFKHSHEHPFPIQDKSVSGKVEKAFLDIFHKACGFFNRV